MSVLCYANSLRNGFVFDDSAYLASPTIRNFEVAEAIFGNWLNLELYRPLALLSLAWDYYWYQESPFGYHLTNLLLHTLNSILFYFLVFRLIAHRGASLIAALFYGVHPLQTEVVNWISARGDLLMGCFFITGLSAHMRAADIPSANGKRNLWRWLAWLCFAGSMLAKESGIVMLGAVWWFDYCFKNSDGKAFRPIMFTLEWLRRHFSYVLVLGAVLALRWLAIGRGEEALRPISANFLAQASLQQRWLTMASIFLRYLALMLVPLRLTADYSYGSIPLATHLFEPLVSGGLLAFFTLLYLAWRWHSPVSLFAWGLFWMALAPVSNLLFLAPSAMAERYLYLALLPFSVLFGLAVRKALAWRKSVAAAILVLVLGFYAARTIHRNRDWQDDYHLFSAVLEVFPRNARAHENLGHAFYRRGELEQAIEHYRISLAIRPHNVRAHSNLGLLYSKLQRYEEAVLAYKAALHLNHRHVSAHYNMGIAYQRLGRYQEAIQHYRETLRLAPNHAQAARNLMRISEGHLPGPPGR